MNQLPEEPELSEFSPMRLVLGIGSAGTALAGVVLLVAAASADSAWSVGWRVALAIVSVAVAVLCAVSAVLGLAEHRDPESR